VYVLIGAVRDMPAVWNGAICIRKQLVITATIDHRFLDGYQGAVLAKAVREVFDNPWKLSGMDGRPAGSAPAEVAK
jgi:pyruvate dehydrogenase E2 component (dihydrolipoamide acetyltransferase)